MAVELHLPDLPEVPISLGPVPGPPADPARSRRPWHLRLRDALSTYLPLLLMALLAMGTWWLVKNTPVRGPGPAAEVARTDPDYTMTQFAIDRFGPDGRLRVRVEGDVLRHYPDTGRYEIDRARIRSYPPGGGTTLASASRALANADLSELQLHGGAEVKTTVADGRQVEIRSEFLHADLVAERVRTHLPVRVSDGVNDLSASSMTYDHGRRLLELQGRTRAWLAAPPRRQP